MNCEKCKKRVATVHLTEIVGNEKREVNLCAECAAAQGLMVQPAGGMEFLAGLVNEQISQELAAMAGLRCPSCGHTFLAFRAQGRLGCPRDYEVFEEALGPMLERMHGATEHVGKLPPTASDELRREKELARLHRELKRAVDMEDFERAAAIRDRLRERGRSGGPR